MTEPTGKSPGQPEPPSKGPNNSGGQVASGLALAIILSVLALIFIPGLRGVVLFILGGLVVTALGWGLVYLVALAFEPRAGEPEDSKPKGPD